MINRQPIIRTRPATTIPSGTSSFCFMLTTPKDGHVSGGDMPKSQAWRVCSTPGCPEYTQGGRCLEHRREAEQRRGSARQRGYGKGHETRFRPAVLARDPRCVCTEEAHGHASPCGQRSVHADHWPLDRRQLVAQGKDPDDPANGRGLCTSCHSRHTASEQPGGWNA